MISLGYRVDPHDFFHLFLWFILAQIELFRCGFKTVAPSSEKCSARWWPRTLSSHNRIFWIARLPESHPSHKAFKASLVPLDSIARQAATATIRSVQAFQVLLNRVLSIRKSRSFSLAREWIKNKIWYLEVAKNKFTKIKIERLANICFWKLNKKYLNKLFWMTNMLAAG